MVRRYGRSGSSDGYEEHPETSASAKASRTTRKSGLGHKAALGRRQFSTSPLSVSAKAPLHTRQQMRKSYYWGLVINIQLLPAQLRKSSKILWVSAISEAAFWETVSAFIPLSFWQLHAAESICPLFPAV